MSGLCPCGAVARRKFCSRSCAGRFSGGRRPPTTVCPACEADLTIEANVYVGKSGPRKGHRRCRRCVLANGRPDYVPGPQGAPRVPTTRKPKPTKAPAPEPPPEPSRPPWRPAGWGPVRV